MPQAASTREIRAGREFAFTLAGAFLVLGLFALRKPRHYAAAVSFAIAVLFLLAGVILPGRLGPLRRAWMRIGEMIGLVTTPLLMGAVYYLILAPIALVRRLRHRNDSIKGSSWRSRPPLPPSTRMERQF